MILKLSDAVIGSGPLSGGHWHDRHGDATFTFIVNGNPEYQLTLTSAEMQQLKEAEARRDRSSSAAAHRPPRRVRPPRRAGGSLSAWGLLSRAIG